MALQKPRGTVADVLYLATDPVVGTSEVQTLTITGSPAGGTYRLSFKGQKTSALAYNANAAAIDTALEALPTIGTGNIAVTGTGPFTLTFGGTLAKKNVPAISVVNAAFTGGTSPAAAVTTATPGVDASHRGAAVGQVLSANAKLYINTGTATVPVWSRDPDVA